MKKDKLITLLQSIEGNPDIYLWNGYVEDYMDIEPRLQECLMVKESKDHVHKYIRFQYMQNKRVFELTPEEEEQIKHDSEISWKKHYSQWHFPNPFVSADEFDQWYDKKKNVYLINAKLRGKVSWDRMGDVKY